MHRWSASQRAAQVAFEYSGKRAKGLSNCPFPCWHVHLLRSTHECRVKTNTTTWVSRHEHLRGWQETWRNAPVVRLLMCALPAGRGDTCCQDVRVRNRVRRTAVSSIRRLAENQTAVAVNRPTWRVKRPVVGDFELVDIGWGRYLKHRFALPRRGRLVA